MLVFYHYQIRTRTADNIHLHETLYSVYGLLLDIQQIVIDDI